MTFVEAASDGCGPASDGCGPASDAFGLSEQPDKQVSPPMNAARVDQCSGWYCMMQGRLSDNACYVNHPITRYARPIFERAEAYVRRLFADVARKPDQMTKAGRNCG
jgi:hypothetical protein